jgi:hypothetical protein
LAFTAKKKDIRYAAGIRRTDISIYVSRVLYVLSLSLYIIKPANIMLANATAGI